MKERVSKRILGFITAVVALTMSVLDGLEWFTSNEIILATMYSYSAALLGIDAWKELKVNQEQNSIEL